MRVDALEESSARILILYNDVSRQALRCAMGVLVWYPGIAQALQVCAAKREGIWFCFREANCVKNNYIWRSPLEPCGGKTRLDNRQDQQNQER